jgi:hypothetical protein
MIVSHRVLLALFILGILSVPSAWAQPATVQSTGSIAAAVKSASVIDAAGEGAIKSFIAGELGKFREVKTDGVPRAREAIIAEAKGGSAAYLAKFAEVLNVEILAILKDVKDMKARLNAAIVVARVAEIANNTKLEKAVLALLDKGQPEALKVQGMRGARPLLPELIKVNGEKPLIEAVMATVKQFPENGSFAEDAYDALNPRNATGKAIPTIVDALLDLTAWRIEIYKNGVPGQGGKTLIPDLPDADSTAFVNIFFQDVWKSLDKTKKQDVRAMQLACELIHWSAIRGQTPAYQQYRDQLQRSISLIAGGIFVAATVMNEGNCANAAKLLATSATQQSVDLVAAVAPVCAEIPKMKGFEAVHPPQPSPPPDQKGQGNSTAADGGAGAVQPVR